MQIFNHYPSYKTYYTNINSTLMQVDISSIEYKPGSPVCYNVENSGKIFLLDSESKLYNSIKDYKEGNESQKQEVDSDMVKEALNCSFNEERGFYGFIVNEHLVQEVDIEIIRIDIADSSFDVETNYTGHTIYPTRQDALDNNIINVVHFDGTTSTIMGCKVGQKFDEEQQQVILQFKELVARMKEQHIEIVYNSDHDTISLFNSKNVKDYCCGVPYSDADNYEHIFGPEELYDTEILVYEAGWSTGLAINGGL